MKLKNILIILGQLIIIATALIAIEYYAFGTYDPISTVFDTIIYFIAVQIIAFYINKKK